ncbi:MAG: hypothetical protein QOF30_3631 [Acidimicrobiaceae bacterium]|jgi:hypothetical protein|nr:hypothetical protein [Acidimicrobiaceae bacterium]
MVGRSLVVVEELKTRQSNAIVKLAMYAGVRRGVDVSTTTFDELFTNPSDHLAGVATVAMTAWTTNPADTAAYFRPTQTPAACAASLALKAGAQRVTAVMPTSVDEEFPLLLAVHLHLAGVTMIVNFLDLVEHEHTDAMVDPNLAMKCGRVPTQDDLDTLHQRIDEIKKQGHPGWRFDQFDLQLLRQLAAEHPNLAPMAADSSVKISRIKQTDGHLFHILENATAKALGLRGSPTAQITLFDLRAFLAFDLYPKTLLGLARAARIQERAELTNSPRLRR